MTLTLTRSELSEEGIFGELTSDDGKLTLATLEHSYNKEPKLYDGIFICKRGVHKLHNNIPFVTFEVTGVKNHTGILFHIGNYNKDSDGCVLVGMSKSGNMVTHSSIAFSKFMSLLDKEETFNLIVKTTVV